MNGIVFISSNSKSVSQSNIEGMNNVSGQAVNTRQAFQQAGQSLIQAGRALQQLANSLTSITTPNNNTNPSGTSPSNTSSNIINSNASNSTVSAATHQQPSTSKSTTTAAPQSPFTSSNSSKSGSPSSSSSTPVTQISIPQGAAAKQVKKWYQPDPDPISSGSKITWHNKDIAAHTATADNGSFDTGIIQPGQSASVVVKGQNKVQYHCSIHPWMHGTLQIIS